MTTTPMPIRLRPDVQGHANAVTGVIWDTTHLGEFPTLSQVACAHLGIGLKATTGQDDRFAVQVCKAIWPLHRHTNHTALLVLQQTYPFGGIADLYPEPLCHGKLLIGEAFAGAYSFHQQATPEIVFILTLKCLPPKGEDIAYPMFLQPF